MRRWGAVVLGLLCLAQAPRTNETIDVSIVNVDVVVTDKEGHRVRGLTKDDFEVLEDGKPQAITNFAEYGAAVANEKVTETGDRRLGAAAATPAPRRTIVVFLDRMRLRYDQRQQFYGKLKETLHRVIRPGDVVALMEWSFGLKTRQSFTGDLGKIDATIDQVAGEDPAVESTDDLMIGIERDHLRAAAALYGNPQIAIDVVPTAADAATREMNDLKGKVHALEAVITSIGGAEGQKVILLATHRFSKLAGLEYLAEGTPDARGTPNQRLFDSTALMQGMTRLANANGVTLYPLFPEGLSTEAVLNTDQSHGRQATTNVARDSALLQNEMTMLNYVAEQTGGTTAWGVQNVADLLPRIGDDLDTYYSLAYRATSRSGDRSRQIVVRPKNGAYSVRARRELADRSDETKVRDRVVAVLYKVPVRARIPIKAKFGAVQRKGKDRLVIPVSVQIPIGSLTMLPEGEKSSGSFTVYVAYGGVLGEVSDITRKTQPFAIAPEDLERAKKSYFTYDVDVDASVYTSRIAVAVVDDVSKEIGVARIELEGK